MAWDKEKRYIHKNTYIYILKKNQIWIRKYMPIVHDPEFMSLVNGQLTGHTPVFHQSSGKNIYI